MNPKRAIIFAAGEGKRLKLVGQHKSLISINGKPLIENLIENLIIANIHEIIIITGYRSVDFLYLQDKYEQIKIITNDQYSNKSSAFAGYLVKKYLKARTLIISGDMVMTRNFFIDLKTERTMCAIQGIKNKLDWIYVLDDNANIIGYQKGISTNNLVLGEWSLLDEKWAAAIQEELQTLFIEDKIINYQMVDVLITTAIKNNLSIKPYILSATDQWDIDIPEDLLKIKKQ